MTPTTPADIAELERLHAKLQNARDVPDISRARLILDTTMFTALPGLLAAARQVPVLQAEVDRLKAENARLFRCAEIAETNEANVVAATLPAPAQAEPVAPIEADVEEEAVAFEQWAHGRHYDMGQHPLHYLFLDSKTYAARDGWRAALAWIKSKLAAPPPPAGEG